MDPTTLSPDQELMKIDTLMRDDHEEEQSKGQELNTVRSEQIYQAWNYDFRTLSRQILDNQAIYTETASWISRSPFAPAFPVQQHGPTMSLASLQNRVRQRLQRMQGMNPFLQDKAEHASGLLDKEAGDNEDSVAYQYQEAIRRSMDDLTADFGVESAKMGVIGHILERFNVESADAAMGTYLQPVLQGSGDLEGRISEVSQRINMLPKATSAQSKFSAGPGSQVNTQLHSQIQQLFPEVSNYRGFAQRGYEIAKAITTLGPILLPRTWSAMPSSAGSVNLQAFDLLLASQDQMSQCDVLLDKLEELGSAATQILAVFLPKEALIYDFT